MEYSKRALEITSSVTLEITSKAKEMKDKGIDVISFGVGEPDFNTPNNIINAAIKAMEDGKTKYTNTNGIINLREAICLKLLKDNNLNYKPSQIVVSTGAKQSLANVLFALLNDGDEVIISNPHWVTYPELIKLAGGVPVICECDESSDYKFTKNNLDKVISNKTKAIIVNSPNNPTGSIYSIEELKVIAEFAKKNNIFIISDEIYEKLIYDDEHESIAKVSEDAYARTIIINGLSKAYAMTGWRVGYTASSEKLANLMNKIQSHTTSNPNSISQYAAVEALNGNQDSVYHMKAEFAKRRDYMIDRLSKIPRISYIYPKGAFYVMVNLKEYIDGENIESSLALSKILLEEANVAVVPGEAFGLPDYIRLSYATSIENIEEGINRIENYLNSIK